MRGARRDVLGALSDDQLGTIAVSVSLSQLRWTPDVAPAVMDRIARDAVAYPEQLARGSGRSAARAMSRRDEPSLRRSILRVLVITTVVVLVAALVLVAATADASGAVAFPLPIVMEVA